MMRRIIDLLRRGSQAPEAAPIPPVTPPLCIVGDLHGRLDLLEQMLHQITTKADRSLRIVFVGDMIDRGPDSADILRLLYALSTQSPETCICLMGNHERMLLDFLDDPVRHGPRWIAAGGAETLTSFGLSPWGRTTMPLLAEQLRNALTPPIIHWIRTLPLYFQSGHIAATHAGASPDHDLEAQSADRMLWGNRGCAEGPRKDQICIAQGHVIVSQAGLRNGRIMVDTGAWRHGRLSAAWLDTNGLSIIEAALPGSE